MPQHMNCYPSGVDVPESAFARRHRRPRIRAEVKPSFHGGLKLARRPLKPKLAAVSEKNEDEEWYGHSSGGELSTADSAECADVLVAEVEASRKEDAAPADLDPSEHWPSLHQATCDWELCSEASDVSSFSVISDAASDVSGLTATSWVPVGRTKEELPKSYASRLMSGNEAASEAPLPQQWPVRRTSSTATAAAKETVKPCQAEPADLTDSIEDFGDFRTHGWQKNHKATNSAVAVRQVASSRARRAEQSRQSRE